MRNIVYNASILVSRTLSLICVCFGIVSLYLTFVAFVDQSIFIILWYSKAVLCYLVLSLGCFIWTSRYTRMGNFLTPLDEERKKGEIRNE